MKKISFILIINIILIVFLFLIFDFFIYSYNIINFKNTLHDLSNRKYSEKFKIYKEILFNQNNFKHYIHDLSYNGYKENIENYKKTILNGQYLSENNPDSHILENWKNYRPIENIQSDKNILIFGCSFAYGMFLKDNETFSHFLGKLTEYNIYNRSHNGRSAQHMLYQLENKDLIKSLPKPDYVIYVFIPHHIRRTWLTCVGSHKDFYYKKTKNNTLKLNSPSIERYITGFFENILNETIGSKKVYYYKKWETELYFLHITKSIDLIKKIWGNDVKFIFFAYEDFYNEDFYLENLNKLEKNGIICIRLSDLSDKNYANNINYRIGEFEYHPNAKAWEEITPLFVNYLQKMGYLK